MRLSTHDYISHDVKRAWCEKKNFFIIKNHIYSQFCICLNKFTNRFDIIASHFMRVEKIFICKHFYGIVESVIKARKEKLFRQNASTTFFFLFCRIFLLLLPQFFTYFFSFKGDAKVFIAIILKK